jgi:LysM repeat protein
MQKLTIAILTLAACTLGSALEAQSLLGSRASMERQNQQAIRYGYTFLRTSQSVRKFVDEGHLIRISADRDLELHDVSYPYARPAVKTFIDRLSGQYHVACGEKLTVTSLTRPINKQPSNAASDSVHPTGMAVDLRIPSEQKCRSWLENTLLSLESTGVLDVTRERHPAHYHVAVFTQTYEQYVAEISDSPAAPAITASEYIVRRGDTLSVIADKTGTTVANLRAANSLRGNLIRAGQKLQIPGSEQHAMNAGSTRVAAKTVSTELNSADARANELAAVTEVSHRVKRGDTLWRIANRYGTSTNSLKRENGLTDDVLQVGQLLRISLNGSSR